MSTQLSENSLLHQSCSDAAELDDSRSVVVFDMQPLMIMRPLPRKSWRWNWSQKRLQFVPPIPFATPVNGSSRASIEIDDDFIKCWRHTSSVFHSGDEGVANCLLILPHFLFLVLRQGSQRDISPQTVRMGEP